MPTHKTTARAPRIPRALRVLLTALQGAPFTGAVTRPQQLLASLTSIRGFGKPKAKTGLFMPLNATIWTCCREIEGEACDKRAQIVGAYNNDLAPGEQPIGEANVTALLNLAAAQRCADELDCPKDCPASFTKQKKLVDYRYFAGGANGGAYESGILTIQKSEWNCHCRGDVTD